MEQLIDQLLASLDNATLNRLPCFYDHPGQIQFRIGLNSGGPHIIFKPEVQDVYNLNLRNNNDEFYSYPISVDSERFQLCQSIYQNIRTLCNQSDYSKNVEKNIGILLTNVDNLVKPIFIKLAEKK